MMMRITPLLAASIWAVLIPTLAEALGSDHPNDTPIGGTDKWPAGLTELVNTDQRVHGYFVNWEDILFFEGETAALNGFLEKYAALPDTKLEVVLHPGKLEAKAPWDKNPTGVAADWRLYASPFSPDQVREVGVEPGPFITRIDVYLGGGVVLNELRVPQNVAVTSGGEIEAFIEAHNRAE